MYTPVRGGRRNTDQGMGSLGGRVGSSLWPIKLAWPQPGLEPPRKDSPELGLQTGTLKAPRSCSSQSSKCSTWQGSSLPEGSSRAGSGLPRPPFHRHCPPLPSSPTLPDPKGFSGLFLSGLSWCIRHTDHHLIPEICRLSLTEMPSVCLDPPLQAPAHIPQRSVRDPRPLLPCTPPADSFLCYGFSRQPKPRTPLQPPPRYVQTFKPNCPPNISTQTPYRSHTQRQT